jgi:hypothetical protein
MNAQLPLWVRKAADEQGLGWRLEIEAVPACGLEDTMTVKWYPGEVEWEDGTGEKPASVKIVGRGKPIEIKYKRDDEYEVEFSSAPHIGIYSTKGGFVDMPDVKYVTTHEAFRLEVMLPRAQAEKQGATLPVRFTGKQSGRSMEIKLNRAPATQRLTGVRYTLPDPIQVEALDSILAAKAGEFRGAIVTASFGEVSRDMRVFVNDQARALFRVFEALREHEALWLTVIQSPGVPRDVKEDAQQRLRLVRNDRNLGLFGPGDKPYHPNYHAHPDLSDLGAKIRYDDLNRRVPDRSGHILGHHPQ